MSQTNPSRKAAGRKKKRRSRIRLGRLAVLLLPVLLVFGGIWYFVNSLNPLKLKASTYIAEYGEEFDPYGNVKSLFFDSVSNIKTTGEVDTSKIGDYSFSYTYKGKEYPFTVSVKDTKAPEIILKDYTTDTLETVKAENFIDSINDASLYTYKMDNREDTKEANTYTVTFTAKDQFGNESTATARLIRKNDSQAPTLDGFVKQYEMKQGATYDTTAYTAVDNLDSSPTVSCDTSQLDTTVPGTYDVKYTVRDRSGNEETYTQLVTINEDPDYGKNIVYLTFDDGPSENTLRVLDILDQYGAKATFFVTGLRPEYNEYMKEIVNRGHTIGLHTYSHNYAQLYSSEDAYFADLQEIKDLVYKQTGVEADCIRFPGGSSNSISSDYNPGIMTRLVQDVQDQGYQYFDWNCDSTDASGNNVPAEQIIANATSSIGIQNVNILFHDTDAKDTTVEALPHIIQAYMDAGYIFRGLTVDSFAPHHGVNN